MRSKRVFFFGCGLAVLLAFPFGLLFAWSPVHPGYRELHLGRADVVYPADRPEDPAYRNIDRYLNTAETFHDLKCSKRITVVACRDWNDCFRFAAPFLLGQRPAAVTIATGSVIYLTPYSFGSWDTGGILRHELSHATLNQNRSLISVWRLLKQPWLSEGIAGVVAAIDPPLPGRQLLSLSPTDFVRKARTEDLWPCFDAVQQKDWRFSYTAWEFFWDRQIELQGKPTFLRFERSCTSDPGNCRADFAAVYGVDLRTAVETYQEDIRSGRFVPTGR